MVFPNTLCISSTRPQLLMGKANCFENANVLRLLTSLNKLVRVVIVGLWVGFFVFLGAKHLIVVSGESMYPTLKDKECVIQDFNTSNIERYDMIIFDSYVESKNSLSSLCIKRVYGLPGETIQIIDNDIYVNGNKIEDPYFEGVMDDYGYATNEIELGDDEYFVLGDNRNNSVDSRHYECGVVKEPLIISKVAK